MGLAVVASFVVAIALETVIAFDDDPLVVPVLWEAEVVASVVIAVRVAPRGVIKELVTTPVFKVTDDPTSSE